MTAFTGQMPLVPQPFMWQHLPKNEFGCAKVKDCSLANTFKHFLIFYLLIFSNAVSALNVQYYILINVSNCILSVSGVGF